MAAGGLQAFQNPMNGYFVQREDFVVGGMADHFADILAAGNPRPLFDELVEFFPGWGCGGRQFVVWHWVESFGAGAGGGRRFGREISGLEAQVMSRLRPEGHGFPSGRGEPRIMGKGL